MADYDSDSSGENNDVETNVLLGYATKESTDDEFSQLGGWPVWLDNQYPPTASLSKCKVCQGYTNLLLQLNADLPDRFPGHERRLYISSCKRKACRRKVGSIRAFRGVRVDQKLEANAKSSVGVKQQQGSSSSDQKSTNASGLGDALFGTKGALSGSGKATQANPFATTGAASSSSSPNTNTTLNPFAPTSANLTAKSPPSTNGPSSTLSETFASKVRVSHGVGETSSSQTPLLPSLTAKSSSEPWPEVSAFPPAYSTYHIDAEKEFLEPEDGGSSIPQDTRLDTSSNDTSSGGGAEDKVAFESSLDKTFQRFADRLAQNPEQILRYEFQGQPILYSKSDNVGQVFASGDERGGSEGVKVVAATSHKGAISKIPRCEKCGAGRAFELQLTPHAITMLEEDDEGNGLEGMDWGTVILAVCGNDCVETSSKEEVGYVEEWVGVQWEELAGNRKGGAIGR